MDKLTLLKQALISAFSNVVRKAQRGYPIENYETIREAMMFINMIDNYIVDINKTIAGIDYYLRKLNNI